MIASDNQTLASMGYRNFRINIKVSAAFKMSTQLCAGSARQECQRGIKFRSQQRPSIVPICGWMRTRPPRPQRRASRDYRFAGGEHNITRTFRRSLFITRFALTTQQSARYSKPAQYQKDFCPDLAFRTGFTEPGAQEETTGRLARPACGFPRRAAFQPPHVNLQPPDSAGTRVGADSPLPGGFQPHIGPAAPFLHAGRLPTGDRQAKPGQDVV